MKKIKISDLTFLKITLTITLLGILLLLFLVNTLQPRQTNIEEINNNLLNKNVKIKGIIFNIKTFEDSNFQVISIKDDTGKIDITINQITNLKENQEISVTGKVKEYNQHLQVQADKIMVITSQTS